MNILLTTLGFATSHIVVVFIALVCILSLIAMIVSETRSKHGSVQPLPELKREISNEGTVSAGAGGGSSVDKVISFVWRGV